jgi:hypothetical protein
MLRFCALMMLRLASAFGIRHSAFGIRRWAGLGWAVVLGCRAVAGGGGAPVAAH